MKRLASVLLFACASFGQTVAIAPPSFTGTGLNDASSGGVFVAAPSNESFAVVISTAGTPDQFTWAKNGGSPSSPANITGGTCVAPAVAGLRGWQALADGVNICWLASTGHTLADSWGVMTQANGSLSGVSFVQLGDGAVVTRNAQDKARETVSVADFGAVGSGSDETALIRNAVTRLQSGGNLYFPKPLSHYQITAGLVQIVGLNNIKIYGEPGTEIRVAPSTVDTAYPSWPDFGKDSIFRIIDSSNVTIEGLWLNGNIANRTAHSGSESQNSCILIAGSSNITIGKGVVLSGCMTDGVELTPDASGNTNTDIIVEGAWIYTTRRNGITIDGISSGHIRGNTITGIGTIQGIAPMAGIGVEPDNLVAVSKDLDIEGNTITGAQGTYALYAGGFGTSGLNIHGNHIHDNQNFGADFDSYGSYTTGTVSATNGSASISCSGCTWTTGQAARPITINGFKYLLTSVITSTTGTISPVFQQGTASGLFYSIVYKNSNAIFADNEVFNHPNAAAVRIVGANLDLMIGNQINNNSFCVQSYLAEALKVSGNKFVDNLNGCFVGNNPGPYTVGTVALTTSSAAAVGTGTTWTSGMVGSLFQSGTFYALVSGWTDATHITLSIPYTSGGGGAYIIFGLGFVSMDVSNNLFLNNFSAAGVANGDDGSSFIADSQSPTASLYYSGNKIENSPDQPFLSGGIEITGPCQCSGLGNTGINLNPSVNNGLISVTSGIESLIQPQALINAGIIASANTITLTGGYLHISGTTPIQNINVVPFITFDGDSAGCVKVVADGAWSTITGGGSGLRILTAGTAIAGHLYEFCYDAADGAWKVLGYSDALLAGNNSFSGNNIFSGLSTFSGSAQFDISTIVPVYFNILSSTDGLYGGSGNPNGVVTAGAGSLYLDITGQVWKKTGSGSSGWTGLAGAGNATVSNTTSISVSTGTSTSTTTTCTSSAVPPGGGTPTITCSSSSSSSSTSFVSDPGHAHTQQ